jgi:hypothetical protein
MSVLKNKRGISQLEFYHTARSLREDMTKLLLRDFGIKDLEKTDCQPWLIERLRDNLITLLRKTDGRAV